MNEFLSSMIKTASVSGQEQRVGKLVEEFSTSWADKVEKDISGTVYASAGTKGQSVLLAAHMDEIGLMISYIGDKGEIYVCKIGGVYLPMYLGQKVRIHHGSQIVYGCVCVNRSKFKDTTIKDIVIDIGANSKEEAMAVVEIGDTVTYDTDYRELLNNKVTGRAFDDRCGVYVIFEALRRAKLEGLNHSCVAAATVGEESTMNGAYFAAEKTKPSMAIVVDVTYTSDYTCGYDKCEYGDVKIGGGPVLCLAPPCNRAITDKLKAIAKEQNISIQYETSGGDTHTDGDRIHKSAQGVPIALVSVPLRYMHSASEVLSLDDLEDCIELIKNFLLSL